MRTLLFLSLLNVFFPLALRADEHLPPNKTGGCSSKLLPLTASELRFDPQWVVEPYTLEVIRAARRAPFTVAQNTLLENIGTALQKDKRFSQSLGNSSPEHQRENWGLMMQDLLSPNTPDELLLNAVAYGKLDFLRDYYTGHLGAMMRMSQILESDPRIAASEEALRRADKCTLIIKLLMNGNKPVCQIIDQFLKEN